MFVVHLAIVKYQTIIQVESEAKSFKSFKKWFDISPVKVTT